MGKSSLSGQVVAVTGGASGIGFAIVQKLVSLGAKVAVCDISPCPDSLADVPELTFTRVDATSREDVRKWVGATVAKYGRLDAMVPNAGSNFERPGVQRDDAWTKTLDLVLSGPWYAATEAYDQFRKQSGGGAICTTSSIAGLNPSRGAPIYSACKAGVNGLTKALAVEWAKDNVRINAVAPGVIETEGYLQLIKEEPNYDFQNKIPILRVGKVEEIASTTCFLLSDEASYITGQTLAVDGAMSCVGS